MRPTSRSSSSSTRSPPTCAAGAAAGRRRRLGAPGGRRPGAADTSFRTTLMADPRSNSLILRAANPARANLVRSLVEKLDRDPADSSNGAAGNIYVVYLKNADAVRWRPRCAPPWRRTSHHHAARRRHGSARRSRRRQRPAGSRQQGLAARAAARPPGQRAAEQRQPALHRRPDPGRPVDQLADHHGARAAVPPDARRDRQARRPPRAGDDRSADRRGQRQQGRELRRPVAKRAGQQRVIGTNSSLAAPTSWR
jgi:hypothetical protein